MRYVIREEVRKYMSDNIKPNYAALARQYNFDYRTVKQAYKEDKYAKLDATFR